MTSQKTEYSRTAVYLDTASEPPKHMFLHIAAVIESKVSNSDSFCLLDVGSANGAFLRYMRQACPTANLAGLEYDPRLVGVAKSAIPGVNFMIGDANCMDVIGDRTFDIVTMTGTHSIFDDFRTSFSECIRVAKEKGTVVVTGIFNPFPVDALIYWRYGAQFNDNWHPGYNLFSKLSIATYLDSHPRVRSHKFEPFAIPFDVAPREDIVRSWTEADANGQRQLRNGIMPLNFETLTIDVAEK
jgi:SAM-dependent methyltransferase